MKRYLRQENLPWLTMVMAGICMLLRIWQIVSINNRGFIIRGHISGVLLYTLCAAFFAVITYATIGLRQANKYAFNFPANPVSAMGSIVCGACFAVCAGSELMEAGTTAARICALVGVLAAVSLVYCGYCRNKGQRPAAMYHIIVCVYLVLRLYRMYMQWSADPQLQDYCFQLVALVCAMLAAYHRASFDADIGKRGAYALYSFCGAFCCCVSLAGPGSTLFYLGTGCWLMTDFCNLTPLPREYWAQEEAEECAEEPAEEPEDEV